MKIFKDDKITKEKPNLEYIMQELKSQRKIIEEQEKKINSLTEKLDAIKPKNDMEFMVKFQIQQKKIDELFTEVESLKTDLKNQQFIEGTEPLTEEERRLLKAGRYVKKQISDVNKAYIELDERLATVRGELLTLHEIEQRFKTIEDNLNSMQRHIESVMENEFEDKINILKETGKEVEEIVNKKLEKDKEILEALQNTIFTMNEAVQRIFEERAEKNEIEEVGPRLEEKATEEAIPA